MQHLYLPKRYLVIVLAAIGYFIFNLIQLNIGIAVISMASNKAVIIGNETKFQTAEFRWTSVEKGFILGAYSIGSVFSLLAGPIIQKFGGATTVGSSAMVASVIELVSPFLLYSQLYIFLVGRTAVGFFEGVATVAVVDTIVHWSPMAERTRLSVVPLVGRTVSGAVNYPMSAYIAHLLGWTGIFYTSGTMLLIWSFIWLIFVYNDPKDDKFISEAERNYLETNITNITNEKVDIPWKEILSSKEVWALLNEFFCSAWCASFISHCLPLYVKDVHNVNIKDVGLLTGIPMLCNFIALPIAAYIADILRLNTFSIAKVHRIFIFWGHLCILILLLVASFFGNFLVCMICFCLIRISFSLPGTSYGVITIDMGGQHAGVLKSMTYAVFGLGSFLNSVVIGYMVTNHTQSEWNVYFLLLSAISMYGVIMFLIFGSGELQSWAVLSDKNTVQSQQHQQREIKSA